jgi:hypothetical protein
MANDLESLVRMIDELPLARAKREGAKAELIAAFALLEALAALVARMESLAASLARTGGLVRSAVAERIDLGEERPPAAD